VKNEIDHLRLLHHPHLTQVFAAGEVPVDGFHPAYPYFVMDHISNPQDIAERLTQILDDTPDAHDLPRATLWLAEQLNAISQAIQYLHRCNTLHFDIKPANILIDESGRLVVSDLGFAKKKTDSSEQTVIGFTLFYAHPDLRSAYEHMSSLNRVRRRLTPSEFMFAWDIYALGRTVLQLLAMIHHRFPDTVLYDYVFVYLHLMACRMLDGRNLTKEESSRIRDEHARRGEQSSVYFEDFLTLQADDLSELKYGQVDQICRDLTKLVERDYYIQDVPELSAHYPHRVQIAAGAPAPFSPRIKAIVEHPVFLRLRSVKQLGTTDTIYPGCTHTRFEHSLGAFRMCWLYIQALESDPFNPLFRQLTDERDLKALLVASLVHDLGQYPLAHELEDAASASPGGGTRLKEAFQHERLSVEWLKNTSRDPEGRTIREIIENLDWGWNVPIESITELVQPAHDVGLPFRRAGLKQKLLRSVVDGPIDVDKLDYLVRDSKRAELPYGEFVDVDRLVRSLTVVLSRDDHGRTSLLLGSYEKGQSAAESVTFARYELYQALYWHHAVRAVRPMLREVLRASASTRKGRPSLPEAFVDFLGVSGEPRTVSVESVLEFLAQYASEEGKLLVEMIRQRRFYKRLVTVHNYQEEEGRPPLLQRFREVHRRPDFDKTLQDEIRRRFDQYMATLQGPQPSVLAPERSDAVAEELKKPGRILSDCPSPRGGSYERLRFALEPKRRLQNYASRVEVGERVSEVWQNVHFRLMEIASKGRVYCHPSIRDALMAALGPSGIREALNHVIDV
jgi:HD superfamily phosphohydrolase